jgi:hypothetical protein
VRLRDDLIAAGRLQPSSPVGASAGGFLRQEEIGAILHARMPRAGWVPLQDVYEVVASHSPLTTADLEPEAPGAASPRWKRNVRNYLQAHKQSGEIEWDGEASYRYLGTTASADGNGEGQSVSPADIDATADGVHAGWDLRPGDQVRRSELHTRYGGSGRGGTAPSRSSPNIFLFLDRAVAAQHGYFDGWVGAVLYYTGHGQRGDQEVRAGNAAILRHQEDGRAIRVLRRAGGIVTYLGRFELDVGGKAENGCTLGVERLGVIEIRFGG